MKNHFKKLMHNVENQIENDFRNHLNNFLTTRKNQIDNNLRNNFKESSWRKIISVMIWEIISMKSTKNILSNNQHINHGYNNTTKINFTLKKNLYILNKSNKF
jgi:hypothetical protein